MANYVQTASSVLPSGSAVIIYGTAGAAIAAGQPVYEDTADLDAANKPKLKPYSANSASPAAQTSGPRGLAANSAATGQPVGIVLSDPDFTHGLTGAVKGDVIIAASTAGSLAPVADLASGWRPAVMAIATSATKAVVGLFQNTTAK